MKNVSIFYRSEDGSWWAESPDIPGWTAAGDSFDEVRALAIEGAQVFADEPVAISEVIPSATPGTSACQWTQGVLQSGAVAGIFSFQVVVLPANPYYPTSRHVPTAFEGTNRPSGALVLEGDR